MHDWASTKLLLCSKARVLKNSSREEDKARWAQHTCQTRLLLRQLLPSSRTCWNFFWSNTDFGSLLSYLLTLERACSVCFSTGLLEGFTWPKPSNSLWVSFCRLTLRGMVRANWNGKLTILLVELLLWLGLKGQLQFPEVPPEGSLQWVMDMRKPKELSWSHIPAIKLFRFCGECEILKELTLSDSRETVSCLNCWRIKRTTKRMKRKIGGDIGAVILQISLGKAQCSTCLCGQRKGTQIPWKRTGNGQSKNPILMRK